MTKDYINGTISLRGNIMICPKCKQNMVEGYVPSNTMKLQFIPAEGTMPKTIFSLGKGAVQLSKMPMWFSARALAHYCQNCRFVIINEYTKAKDNAEDNAEDNADEDGQL